MTRISGHILIASPCCKSLYKTPYGFMNLSATGYWTDEAKENSLWSTSGGAANVSLRHGLPANGHHRA